MQHCGTGSALWKMTKAKMAKAKHGLKTFIENCSFAIVGWTSYKRYTFLIINFSYFSLQNYPSAINKVHFCTFEFRLYECEKLKT